MNKQIFDFLNYKAYLKEVGKNKIYGGRGFRSRLAAALRCQSAYISQVLNGNADFSLEQAELVNGLLNHNKNEAHFFILLVQYTRAGSTSLKNYFHAQIQKVLQERVQLKDRLEYKKTLSSEDQAVYYSAWYYAAVHMLLSVPAMQAKEAVSEFLKLPMETVHSVLDFLISTGLAMEEGGRYKIGSTSIHLGADSAMSFSQHTNWRMKAIASLTKKRNTDLHYSSLVSISKNDIPKVREIMVKAIEEIRGLVRDSKEETVCCYLMDLFGLD